MIKRVRLTWPTETQPADSAPVRLLAVSDEPEPALDFERNRAQIGKVDAIIGCGDLEPDYLNFLTDAFRVPLIYVRGNHDRGVNWQATSEALPEPLSGKSHEVPGITLLGLPWPGETRNPHAVRDDSAAWRQVLPILVRPPRTKPLIVMSHVPPEGLGDTPEDYYHRGFAAYEMVCRRLHPMLWLHGHTSLAAARDWRVTWGETTLVNVTGAVLVEIAATAPETQPGAQTAPDTIAAMSGAKQ
jgi:Icc-related predicted phosphoesterase